jgi:hypothetical protein
MALLNNSLQAKVVYYVLLVVGSSKPNDFFLVLAQMGSRGRGRLSRLVMGGWFLYIVFPDEAPGSTFRRFGVWFIRFTFRTGATVKSHTPQN